MIEQIRDDISLAVREFLDICPLGAGDIFVVGCSSSEVAGHRIGTGSSREIGQALFEEIHSILNDRGIFLAAQCCEHLNRALVLERAALERYALSEVNVVPQPKAGGAFAAAAYHGFLAPAMVETVKARGAMDIGNTLIGMHLLPVVVPVRLSVRKIGQAHLTCGKSRPKYIGGERAAYNESLL